MDLLVKLILNCSDKYNGHNQIEMRGCSVTIQEVMLLVESLEEHLDVVTLQLYNEGTGGLYESRSGKDGDRLLICFSKITY